ncbi:hypothetical protein ACHAWF_014722 [Thalassiosira exigua]
MSMSRYGMDLPLPTTTTAPRRRRAGAAAGGGSCGPPPPASGDAACGRSDGVPRRPDGRDDGRAASRDEGEATARRTKRPIPPRARAPRRRRRRKDDDRLLLPLLLSRRERRLLLRSAFLWISGVCLIELRFFYGSLVALDRAFLEGGGRRSSASWLRGSRSSPRPPVPRGPPPPATSVLPKKLIAVFGPESSGSTFLSTTLGVATGAWGEGGKWIHEPAWALARADGEGEGEGKAATKDEGEGIASWLRRPARARGKHKRRGRYVYEKDLTFRARSPDGIWEVQHLSLPWGWQCEEDDDVEGRVVEALVPAECFRYASDPGGYPREVEKRAYATRGGFGTAEEWGATGADSGAIDRDDVDAGAGAREVDAKARKRRDVLDERELRLKLFDRGTGADVVHSDADSDSDSDAGSQEIGVSSDDPGERERLRDLCRTEARISSSDPRRTCGAACGRGRYDGYALYPPRFSINVTSHVRWYLDRGVDVRVVLSLRDRTASRRSKLQGHCHLKDVGEREDAIALELMAEALERWSGPPTAAEGGGVERVVTASYEGLMALREPYLFGLYRRLGVNSTYVPKFVDGNRKYVAEPDPTKKEDANGKADEAEPGADRRSKGTADAGAPPRKDETEAAASRADGGANVPARRPPSDRSATRSIPRRGEPLLPERLVVVVSRSADDPLVEILTDAAAAAGDGRRRSIRRLALPAGGSCDDGAGRVVEALVPPACAGSAGTSPAEAPPADSDVLRRCRDELGIREGGTSRTCGAECGAGERSGLALYPPRYFVNVTTHVEWYLSRGVDVTAVLVLRDRSVANKERLEGDCPNLEAVKAEDRTAISIMRDAYAKYGTFGSSLKDGEKERVVAVSYEGLGQFRGAYLSDLCRRLGLPSSNLPAFEDGNAKHMAEPEKVPLRNLPLRRKRDDEPLLPKKVIAVFGLESSGTTFLASALGAALGIIDPEVYAIRRQGASRDGEYEVQHLSLPWGWQCEEGQDAKAQIVEALVPQECFRYERDPSLDSRIAPTVFFNQRRGRKSPPNKKPKGAFEEERRRLLHKCRHELKISKDYKYDGWSCGAVCGGGEYDGYALYPERFSVNISSHIEWYLSRGVDIKVVLSIRDRNIEGKAKFNEHCHMEEVGKMENEVALGLMTEAIEKYGKRGSRRGSLPGDVTGEERVFVVSYEGLMDVQESYLRGLYQDLGINSTHTPSFQDGNKKYVTSANVANLDARESERERRRREANLAAHWHRPQTRRPPPSKESLLPKRLITVVGRSRSNPFSNILAVASGALLSAGQGNSKGFSEQSSDEDSAESTVTSLDGELAIQHISLPSGSKCDSAGNMAEVVEALVPEDCIGVGSPSSRQTMSERCRREVHIEEGSARWTCGAKCGEGQDSGLAFYPTRFVVNITSHIEWYLSRGVDVTVVLVMRDRSISLKEKLKDDCPLMEMVEKEDSVVLQSMKKAIEKYGKSGSLLRSGDKERVIAVSYEGLIGLKDAYLFDLYHQLGINSTYSPPLVDGNAIYVASPRKKAEIKDAAISHKKKASSFHFLPW